MWNTNHELLNQTLFSGEKSPKRFHLMVLGFSERRKSFSSSFLLKISMLICFSRCNLHFQSVLTCLVLNAESITKISNNHKIYCVKCPWVWFWLIFSPYTTRAVFCSMGETLDISLPPWFAISNGALKINSLKRILTFIEIL